MASSGGLILPEPKNVLSELIVERAGEISRVVAPGVNIEHFMSSIVFEINKMVLDVKPTEMKKVGTKMSLVKAVFNAAYVGLIPGEAMGHCYFIPFKSNKAGFTQITYIPGYKGLLELAYANEFLIDCTPEVVLDGEEISMGHDEGGPRIKHNIPCPNRDVPDRSNIVGVYCTYRTKHGGKGVVYVSRDEIAKVDTGKNVWRSNYLAMCLKTPIRRAAKLWRVTRQMAFAIQLDEQQEEGKDQSSIIPQTKDDEGKIIDLDTLEVPSDASESEGEGS